MKTKFLQLIQYSFICGTLIITSCSKEAEKTVTPTVPGETFLAPTTSQKRAALLEDFTGVRCGYCPDGHVRAKAAQESLGKDKFVIMCVHGGGFAAPATGWANFTTSFGNALIGQAGVTGYPAGTISRMVAEDLGATPQSAGGLAMSRSSWANAATAVNATPAPMNIGTKATFDSTTRELTVKVDIYYTADQTNDINNINVALLQSKLMCRQSGDPTPNDPYSQDHVLRHLITGQWGETITGEKTVGTKLSKTYVYKVPADYNGTTTEGGGKVVIADCSVVVFVTRDRKDVLNVVETSIK